MPKITKARASNQHEASDPTSPNYWPSLSREQVEYLHPETVAQTEQLEEKEELVVQEQQPEEEAATDPVAAEVRSWARDNGVEVSERGAIAASVMEQYLAFHREQ